MPFFCSLLAPEIFHETRLCLTQLRSAKPVKKTIGEMRYFYQLLTVSLDIVNQAIFCFGENGSMKRFNIFLKLSKKNQNLMLSVRWIWAQEQITKCDVKLFTTHLTFISFTFFR